MNTLKYESEKLEILKSNNIALSNDSIEIQELSDDKISVKILYAETDFEVIIFLSYPLDFIINTPELLPSEYLLNKMTDVQVLMNLPSLLSWLTSELKNYNKDLHHEFKDIISNLIDNSIIEKNYELLVNSNEATLYLKFSVENLELSSFVESVESNILINSTQHYFIIKIVEKEKSMDFSVTYSSSLLKIFPDLKTLPIELDESDVILMVLDLRNFVIDNILRLKGDWMKRASFLVPLYKHFEEQREMVAFINFETMTELQIGFVTKSKKTLVEIKLSSALDSDQHPKVFLSLQNKSPTSKVKKCDINCSFGPEMFEDVDLFSEVLCNVFKRESVM